MPTANERTLDALAQARQAKQDVVASHGIGSELASTIYAWNDTGHGLAVLMQQPDDLDDEHDRITAAVLALADGMNIHTVTVVKEGYAAERGTKDDRPLAVRFANNDPTVHECLTAVTATKEGEATFAIQPYTVRLGRKVAWHDDKDIVDIRCDQMPATRTLRRALDPDRTTSVDHALEVLDNLGFAALWSTPIDHD